MTTSIELLNAAAELVSRGWTQHRLAADATGETAPYRSRAAVRFCARGAILRAAHDAGCGATAAEADALTAARRARAGVSREAGDDGR